jgi:hypothetical protein
MPQDCHSMAMLSSGHDAVHSPQPVQRLFFIISFIVKGILFF